MFCASYQRYPTPTPSEYCTWPFAPGHCAAVCAGTSARLAGKVTGSLPDGSASPNRIAASALPTSWPEYQPSRTPATWFNHGIVTADPVCNTTIVFGLAAATEEISWFCRPGRSMEPLSEPSLCGYDAKTIGTSTDLARVTARSMPPDPSAASYCTVAPDPARFWIPVSGETVPEEVTVALPPPTLTTPAPPSVPMTAIFFVVAVDSGSTPVFLSRTVLSSLTCRAVALCAAVVTTVPGEPVLVLSNRPKANIGVSTRLTIVS